VCASIIILFYLLFSSASKDVPITGNQTTLPVRDKNQKQTGNISGDSTLQFKLISLVLHVKIVLEASKSLLICPVIALIFDRWCIVETAKDINRN
jgi:hypothetical protein